MISRVIFLENPFKLSQKLLPVLNFGIPEIKYKYSTTSLLQSNNKSSISKHVKSSVPSSFGHKAKEATRLTYYSAVVIAGLGAFCLMMYAIHKELVSSFSTQSVYSAAVDRVSSEPEVKRVFGDVLKCFGETSRRGRRQHISHLPYEIDGRKGIRMKFYMQGQFRQGTVHLDAITCSSGWEYRYLFVQGESYPYQVVVIEDNRSTLDSQPLQESTPSSFSLPSLSLNES